MNHLFHNHNFRLVTNDYCYQYRVFSCFARISLVLTDLTLVSLSMVCAIISRPWYRQLWQVSYSSCDGFICC